MERTRSGLKYEAWMGKDEDGVTQIYSSEKEGSTYYYVVWKDPLMKYWDEHYTRPRVEMEEYLWSKMVIDTNIRDPLKSHHGKLLKHLAAKYLESMFPNKKELEEIKRRGSILWSSQSGNVRENHPMIIKFTNSMILWEKLGVRTWDKVSDMTVKEHQILMTCMETFNIALDTRMKAEELEQRAKGMRVGR